MRDYRQTEYLVLYIRISLAELKSLDRYIAGLLKTSCVKGDPDLKIKQGDWEAR